MRFADSWRTDSLPQRAMILDVSGQQPIRSRSGLREARVENPSLAWDLHTEADFTPRVVGRNLNQVLTSVREIAQRFRRAETHTVLGRICANSRGRMAATLDGVRSAVADLNGSRDHRRDRKGCRLIAGRSLVENARAHNLVDDAFDACDSLPEGCEGLVFSTASGPAVERIGDHATYLADLVNGQVRIHLQQQFFILHADRAVRLIVADGATHRPPTEPSTPLSG